jgi:alpha-methylacyl-CoA racemase
VRIIDLSWRLPGPLATYFLAKQGMEVIKYEDVNHRDPFLKWHWDPAFAEIYKQFQSVKETRLIDFGSSADAEAMRDEIRRADAVVMGFPPRVEAKLGLSAADIDAGFAGICFTRLGFRPGDDHSAHDLNSMAQSNLLKMHILDRTDDIIAPPFLPVTGMFFSYHIAITVLATLLEQKSRSAPIQNWCYLQDAVDHAQEAYYPAGIQDRTPATFLHNGRFPCYNIYRTKDGGYLAMAAVEPKFWERFRALAGLDDLADGDGLVDGDRAVEVKRRILAAIKGKTADEWRRIFAGQDACVDVVGPYR